MRLQAKVAAAAIEAEKQQVKREEKERKELKKQLRNDVQLSQRGRGRPSKAAAAKKKPARRAVGACRAPKPATPPLPPRTYKTRSGRTATLYM